MAATHDTIGQFHRRSDDWTAYTERLQQYFLANDVTSAVKQRAKLLSNCGDATYRTICSLTAPEAPTDKTFEDWCGHLLYCGDR